MQHVAQTAMHPTIALPNAKTIQNKQYNRISPGCVAINLIAVAKPSAARQRCRYIIGTMKLVTNPHARMRRIITSIHPAMADIR